MFIVPARFNRNSPDVQQMGPPADTGRWLIEYMCERIGIANLDGLELLDVGCGVRFADAIINRNISLKSYFGIEVDKEIIEFLTANCTDLRLSFAHFDVRHPLYNLGGAPLLPDTTLPVDQKMFDVICMFSVMTHQIPEDAAALFTILRRHVKDGGRLFFSATLEDGDFGYREMFPETPTANSVYALGRLTEILETNGWRILSVEGNNPRGLPIQDSLLCAPA
jgi:SAM-dependent methyltransferase